MTRRLPPPLVALSPGGLAEGEIETFLRALKGAAGSGLAGVVLREPAMGDRALLDLARACRDFLPWLGVHDRVHLAGACSADAIHLGFRSLAPTQARAILPDGIAIGLSAHAPDRIERWRDADYLFFGPVFDTPSKRGVVEPTGLEGLALAVERSSAPIWAIGGITPERVSECLAAGCKGVAVLSGILAAPQPATAVRAYLDPR